MLKTGKNQNDGKQDWQKTDARVLGQILAAQNILFVLPDTKRIAEFFAQALVSVPGVTSCRVCLGDVSVQAGLDSNVCRECEALRKEAGETLAMPFGFRCRLAEEHDIRIVIITLETSRHTFGFFVFRTDTTGVFESYSPFINNLSKYIALSLENRLQKNLLQKGEEKFRDIYDKSPIGIEVYDSSGALLDINKACLAIFGIADNEDMKGFKLFEDPNITDAVKKKLLEGETVRYEAPFDFEKVKEYRLYRTVKSGTIHLDVLITPLGLKEEVGPVGYLVQVQDVTARKLAEDELKKYQEHLEDIIKERTAELTAANKQLYQEINERKQAEETIRESEAKLREAQRVARVGSWDWDMATDTITWSEEYYHIYGLDPTQRPPGYEEHLKAYTPESAARLDAAVQRSTQTGEPYELDLELARTEGPCLWITARSEAKRDAQGHIIGLRGTAQDITERKKAEDKLQKSEVFIRNILESVDEGFIIIGRDYRIITANRAYADEVRMPVEDIIGKHCYEISHHYPKPCYEAGEDCAVKRVFETGYPYAGTHTHYDSKSDPVYIESKAYPLSKDESGKIMTVIEILVDITEKTKLEAQLRQSQKMEAVGQIAGGIAHDFNNILTAIIGYASITQMKLKEDDPLRHNLDQVLASAERAANLTQGLLAFSRKQISNPAPVNLNELIKKIEKFLRRVIGEDIELKSILSERELTVMADHGQIDQVLMNLATNARDAMPRGGSLTIETGTMEIDEGYIKAHGYGKAGTYALISVTDSGIGMDEKTREKIFEPFFTTKEVGKGTGLGLSIVYGIVKQHNGYVNCYSEPGKGTTFRIYLPLIKTEKRAEIKPSEPVAPMTGTETILLAEDEENVRALTKLVLEEHGYKVIEAIDGEDAVNKFMENKDRIDLLLLDVIMPKMSGKEAYDRIRKIMPDIKVLFASGYPADFIRKDDITEQGLSCVVKPTSPTALIKKMREVLDKK